jgi:hypothetical protein
MKAKIEAAILMVMAASLYALITLALGSITPGDSFLGIPHKEWPLYQIIATIPNHWWWFSGVFLLCCVIVNILDEGLAATLSGLFDTTNSDSAAATVGGGRSSGSSQYRMDVLRDGDGNQWRRQAHIEGLPLLIKRAQEMRTGYQSASMSKIIAIRIVEIRGGVESGTVWSG